MLHTALPEVFAGLPGRCLESVLLLVILKHKLSFFLLHMSHYLTYILISNSEHEIFSFKINLANPRPEVVANLINGNIEGEAINQSAKVCKPSSYFPER